MTKKGDYPYDVFISYNEADESWVLDWLVPRLKKAGFRVATKYEVRVVGTPTIRNIENGVDSSYQTIVVLTPAWVADEGNEFESLLVLDKDKAARQRKLLPVLLQPCDLPPAIAFRQAANFTNEARWEKALKHLIRGMIDAIPVAPPWQASAGPGRLESWQRWLYRYRHRFAWGLLALLLVWVVTFTWLEIWPFQPRLVWRAETLTPPQTALLHNTGETLISAGANIELGCRHAYKGLRYRSLNSESEWQNSQVPADLLCIEDWQGAGQDALSDIVAVASPADQAQLVYALTSHSGLLVSEDAGRSFKHHPASENMPGLVITYKILPPLMIHNGSSLDLWVLSDNQGVWRYRQTQWHRLDGQGATGCTGLPTLTFLSLLVTDDLILIGTESQGLWASYDDGQTCRPVFDSGPNPRYDFHGLWDVSLTHPRYLALVHDWNVEPGSRQGNWQLLDLCPRPDSCSQTAWQAETKPVWDNGTALWGNPPAGAVLVQRRDHTYEWFLVTEAGQVWRGDMEGSGLADWPDIRRCYNPVSICDLDFAPADDGATPYLLAANRIYRFVEGSWWRRLWP